jgi:tetratricopeptide (TPR) repeat protein
VPTTDRHFDRQLRQAESLRSQNRFRDAAEIYQSILQTAPEHSETLYQFGVMANMTGQHGLAADLIQRAMRQSGSRGLHYLSELAPALALSGRPEEALAAFRRVVDARPDDATAHYNMGNLLNGLGKPGEAATARPNAVALAPDFAEAHANLGGALHMAKRYEDAVAAYRSALETFGDNADLHHNLGAVCHALGRNEDAAAAYRRAVDLAPDRLAFRQKLAETLQELGAYGDATEIFRAVLTRAPSSVDATKGLAETMIGNRTSGDAVALCDDYLEAYGYNSAVINCKAMALTELGESAAGRHIMDLQRFIEAVDVDPPAGYASLTAFNEAIEAEIRAHESLDFEPLGLATSSGFQTGELLDAPSYAIGLLAMMINGAVRGYMENLPDDPGHPFVANVPTRWTMNGWGVILQAHGHQRAHIHPSGWLSGVYYVRVPDSIGTSSKNGWIEFGTPPGNIGCRAAHEAMQVQPVSGRMLLFPSYVYHHTIPYHDSENRISFAFDVVPVKT